MDDDIDSGRGLFDERDEERYQEREDEFHYKDRQLDEYTMPLSGASLSRASSDSVGESQASSMHASMQSPVSPSSQYDAAFPSRPHSSRNVNFADANPSYEPQGMPTELPFAVSQRSMATSRDSGHSSGNMSQGSSSLPSAPRSGRSPRSTFRPAIPRDSSVMQIGFDGTTSEIPVGGFKSSDTVQTTSAMSQGSGHSANSFNENGSQAGSDGGEGGDNFSTDGDGSYSDAVEPIILWNVKFPIWLSRLLKKPPSLSRISAFIVRTAPCFWFCGNRVQGSSTDRAVLTRLNILCAFFCFFQVVASCWLAMLLLVVDDQKGIVAGFAPNFWNLNGAALSVGILACTLMLTCFLTIKVIQRVDLVRAIRYLWVLLWIVPFEIFFNISLFDYHRVTLVWIKHWYVNSCLG